MLTCLYALILICSNTFMIGCSYVNMLCWSHTFKFTCHNDRVLPYLHVLMITCPLAYMLSSSYAWMLWWLHVHMHWYSLVWYPHTCAHTLMMKCLLAWRLKWSCSSTFLCLNVLTRLCLNAEMIERLEVCVLGCLNTHMHVRFHDHALACSHALLITYNHLTFLWW